MKNLNNIIQAANDYFAAIASSHVKIQHSENARRYATMGIEEIISAKFDLANLSDQANPTTERFVLVFEPFELEITGPNAHNIASICTGAVWILNFAEKENHTEITRIAAAAAEIGLQIAAKIEDDKRRYSAGEVAEPFVKSFNPSTVVLNKVGPVSDQLHGYRMEFSIDTTGALVHESQNWI